MVMFGQKQKAIQAALDIGLRIPNSNVVPILKLIKLNYSLSRD